MLVASCLNPPPDRPVFDTLMILLSSAHIVPIGERYGIALKNEESKGEAKCEMREISRETTAFCTF